MSEEQQKPKRGAWQHYQVDVAKKEVKVLRKKCPRCGNFMALHEKDKKRYYCGRCHYTEYL